MSQAKGLIRKYNITKADGESCEPAACYFVLRIDKFGNDPLWGKLCREAMSFLAKRLLDERHLEELAHEMFDSLVAMEEDVD